MWLFAHVDRPGAANWVFYETAPGHRVYIYRGTRGDATGFYPRGAFSDSTGLWFSDANFQPVIWHWELGVGLSKFLIGGLPAGLHGRNAYVLTVPAGPCF